MKNHLRSFELVHLLSTAIVIHVSLHCRETNLATCSLFCLCRFSGVESSADLPFKRRLALSCVLSLVNDVKKFNGCVGTGG